MQRGYIKIWRKLEDSGLLQMHSTLAMFMYMLMKANHKPSKFGLVEVDRGELVSGRFKLAEHLGLSERNVRTCLQHLHDLNMITSKPTNKFTVYTIVNYGQYQDVENQNDQPAVHPSTNNRPTTDQQPTTSKELKHLNIKEENKYIPPIPDDLFAEWLSVRKKKKSGNVTERVWNGIVRESKIAGISAERAIEVCCEKGWASFDASWYVKTPVQVTSQSAALVMFNCEYTGCTRPANTKTSKGHRCAAHIAK